MIKKSTTVILLLLAILSSCSSIDKLTQFEMNFSQNVSVEPLIIINTPITIPTPAITTNTTSTLKSYNTSEDLIESIKLTEMKLTIVTPTDEDFSFLKTVEVSIVAEGESDTKIAWIDEIPLDTNTITMKISDTDIKNFILKDSFSLKFATSTDEVSDKKFDIKIDTKVKVDASILGI